MLAGVTLACTHVHIEFLVPKSGTQTLSGHPHTIHAMHSIAPLMHFIGTCPPPVDYVVGHVRCMAGVGFCCDKRVTLTYSQLYIHGVTNGRRTAPRHLVRGVAYPRTHVHTWVYACSCTAVVPMHPTVGGYTVIANCHTSHSTVHALPRGGDVLQGRPRHPEALGR